MTLNDAPPSDLIEISLFGPGLGESLAIHYGGGRWIVVDSCIDPESGAVAALQYFERMGIDCGTVVTHVVATHAHDDHIGGLADVLGACPQARFVCPVAMVREPFTALLGVDSELEGLRRAAFREFRQIHEILQARKNRRNRLGSYLYGIEGRMILKTEASTEGPSIEIEALTPSDTALTRSLTQLARLYPTQGAKKRLNDLPNETSLALWIEIGQISMILGSDVEIGPTDCGWKGVMAWEGRPTAKAEVFKVAHHGSHTGHHEPMWKDMLIDSPVSILTPFENGRVSIPTEGDLRRIALASSRTFITVAPSEATLSGAVRSMTSTLGGVVENRRVQSLTMGHVRLRRDLSPGGAWVGVTNHPATEIEITPPQDKLAMERLANHPSRNKSKRRAEAKKEKKNRKP
jgi:hypothetical protein